MTVLFWSCALLVFYAYAGYPLCLWIYARGHAIPVHSRKILPTVSIIIAARNEAERLPAKLRNLAESAYPRDRLEIIVASDGSTDQTQAILESAPGIVPVILPVALGKAAAINEAVQLATGEILVFLDARQSIETEAINELVACFADTTVGAASGELLLDNATGGSAALGVYWQIEKAIRKLESATGSVVGATGAIYAVRRDLYRPIPAGTILDDVYVPMQVVRQGKRVVFQASAVAHDRMFQDSGKEMARKVRTLTGNYQLVQRAPWLITPANPLLLRFISHKLMRLAVPMLLVLMLYSTAVGVGEFCRVAFFAQALFYGLAAAGALVPAARKLKPVSIANTFVMLNAAAAFAFFNFLTGRKAVWTR